MPRSLTPFSIHLEISLSVPIYSHAACTQGTKVLLSRDYGSNYGFYGKKQKYGL